MAQASAPSTRTRTVAGELVRAETRTLPVTVTVTPSVWTTPTVGGPRVAFPVSRLTVAPTSPAFTLQSSVTVAPKVTRRRQRASTGPPEALRAAVGPKLCSAKFAFERSKKMSVQ